MKPIQVYILSFLLTLCLAIITIYIVERNEAKLEYANLELLSDEYVFDFKRDIDKSFSVLEGLKFHFKDDSIIYKEQFSKITKTLLHTNRFLKGLSYNPIVDGVSRNEFELWNKQYNKFDFEITEKENGVFKKRALDSKYVVVQYIEPMSSNSKAVGFDINSSPTRRNTIDRAIRTRNINVTEPITLVQSNKKNNGLLALNPILLEDSVVSGFFVGVFAVDALVQKALDNQDIIFELNDITETPISLYSNLKEIGDYEFEISRQIDVMGRLWECSFYYKETPFDLHAQRWLIGLIFFLVCGFLFLMINFTHRLKISNENLEEANSQVQMLLKEVHHRVKNNLQIVNSFIGLEKNRTKDEVTLSILSKTQTRIGSMSSLHELIYEDNDFESVDLQHYVGKLFSFLRKSMASSDIGSEVLCNNKIELDLTRAVTLGLLINELFTNSLKYAFTNIDDPQIKLELSEENGYCVFLYSDNGIGVQEGVKSGLGSKLIKRLVQQLKGDTLESDLNVGFSLKFKFKL